MEKNNPQHSSVDGGNSLVPVANNATDLNRNATATQNVAGRPAPVQNETSQPAEARKISPKPEQTLSSPDIGSIVTTLPSEEKPKRVVWVVIAVLVLVIVAAVGFYFYTNYSEKDIEPEQSLTQPNTLVKPTINLSPTPKVNSTGNWKTYVGADYLIKYQDLELFSASTSGKIETLTYKLDNNANKNIIIAISGEETSLQNLSELDLGEDLTVLSVKIGDHDAKKVIEKETADSLVTYYLLNDGKLYQFEVSELFDSDYLDQILATFEFVEKGQVIGCNMLDLDTPELSYIDGYCSGAFCNSKTTKEECEAIDVVAVATDSGRLLEDNQADGIGDCVWDEATSGFAKSCKIKYE